MYEVLQWIGGGCYLLQKVLLSFAERARSSGNAARERRLRIVAWAVYLVGLPPWIIIFVTWHDWIAAAVEASGAPAMALGLVVAIRGITKDPPKWLIWLAFICALIGIVMSVADFGSLTALSQWLEIGLAGGYLVGTILLARQHPSGYLWYVLMHISCGWLMHLHGYPWLLAQQVASLGFIVYAYVIRRRRASAHNRAV